MKKNKLLFPVILMIIAAMVMFGCKDPDPDPDPTPTPTPTPTPATWTLEQKGGTDGTATTTHIVVKFNKDVTLLTQNVTLSAGFTKSGALVKSGNNWEIPITFEHPGSVSVTISSNQAGVESGTKSVLVYKEGELIPITYTAAADGTTDTATSEYITFTFTEDVDIALTDITITAGTGAGAGSASKGATLEKVNNDAKVWKLAITVTTQGNITVKIDKTGIDSTVATVAVFKELVTSFDYYLAEDGQFYIDVADIFGIDLENGKDYIFKITFSDYNSQLNGCTLNGQVYSGGTQMLSWTGFQPGTISTSSSTYTLNMAITSGPSADPDDEVMLILCPQKNNNFFGEGGNASIDPTTIGFNATCTLIEKPDVTLVLGGALIPANTWDTPAGDMAYTAYGFKGKIATGIATAIKALPDGSEVWLYVTVPIGFREGSGAGKFGDATFDVPGDWNSNILTTVETYYTFKLSADGLLLEDDGSDTDIFIVDQWNGAVINQVHIMVPDDYTGTWIGSDPDGTNFFPPVTPPKIIAIKVNGVSQDVELLFSEKSWGMGLSPTLTVNSASNGYKLEYYDGCTDYDNHSLMFEIDLGTETLSDYASVKFNFSGTAGDWTYKDMDLLAGSAAFTDALTGSTSVSSAKAATGDVSGVKVMTINIDSTKTASYTGKFYVSIFSMIGKGTTPNWTAFEISEIEFVK
jgi:hypothetical protein